MIALNTKEKYARPEDLICFSDVILRWRFHAVIKVTYHITVGIIPLMLVPYRIAEKTYTDDHKIFLKLTELDHRNYDQCASCIPNMVFLISDVEKIEIDHPEYRASRELNDDEPDCYLASEENLREVMAKILMLCGRYGLGDSIIYDLNPLSEKISDARTTLYLPVPQNKIIHHDVLRPLELDAIQLKSKKTVYEQAELFVSTCSPKTEAEEILAFLELELRFPSLKRHEVAMLLPARRGAEISKESYEKRYSRLKKEAHKYRNIEIA